jgi:hypothetical protein
MFSANFMPSRSRTVSSSVHNMYGRLDHYGNCSDEAMNRKAGAKGPGQSGSCILFTQQFVRIKECSHPPLHRLFPITFFEAFLFTFPSPFFASVVVWVARLITLAHTSFIMSTAMTNATMLPPCLRHYRGARDGTTLLRRLRHCRGACGSRGASDGTLHLRWLSLCRGSRGSRDGTALLRCLCHEMGRW